MKTQRPTAGVSGRASLGWCIIYVTDNDSTFQIGTRRLITLLERHWNIRQTDAVVVGGNDGGRFQDNLG